ncbi:MAG: hypothetical protein C4295_10490 [Candidatus Fervidibacterota bacterium]
MDGHNGTSNSRPLAYRPNQLPLPLGDTCSVGASPFVAFSSGAGGLLAHANGQRTGHGSVGVGVEVAPPH